LVIPNDKEDTLLHITHYGVLLFVLLKSKQTKKQRRLVSKIAKTTLLEMQFQSLYDRIENTADLYLIHSYSKIINAKKRKTNICFLFSEKG
jgi:hypothetical protein